MIRSGLAAHVVLVLLLLQPMACAAASAAVEPKPAVHSTPDAPIEPPSYSRRSWRHWIDADHDCQNTRTEVLIAESEVPVEFADGRDCRVRRGRWTCPYTGRVVTDPAKLDINHLVPLENAHRSGGWRWSRERKEAYANDLTDAEHLIAVLASANRSKGSRGPEAWLPSNVSFVCEYVREWRAVKAQWSLSMSDAERDRADDVLAGCDR